MDQKNIDEIKKMRFTSHSQIVKYFESVSLSLPVNTFLSKSEADKLKHAGTHRRTWVQDRDIKDYNEIFYISSRKPTMFLATDNVDNVIVLVIQKKLNINYGISNRVLLKPDMMLVQLFLEKYDDLKQYKQKVKKKRSLVNEVKIESVLNRFIKNIARLSNNNIVITDTGDYINLTNTNQTYHVTISKKIKYLKEIDNEELLKELVDWLITLNSIKKIPVIFYNRGIYRRRGNGF